MMVAGGKLQYVKGERSEGDYLKRDDLSASHNTTDISNNKEQYVLRIEKTASLKAFNCKELSLSEEICNVKYSF